MKIVLVNGFGWELLMAYAVVSDYGHVLLKSDTQKKLFGDN